MRFKEYYHLSLKEINEEIDKDKLLHLNKPSLFESPLFHEAEYFDRLNDIKTNHPFALERLADSKYIENILVGKTQYHLLRKIDGYHIWDFFLSGTEGHEQMSAFVKYTKTDNTMSVKGLWQIDFVLGLVRELIIGYYSKHFSILKSDSITNGKGKKFFQNLAKDFLSKGKKVTVLIKDKEIPYLLEDAELYWNTSFAAHSAEKIIVYYFKDGV